MRFLTLIMILTMGISSVSIAQNKKSEKSWSNDALHSQLAFQVKHMGISKTYGQFDKFTITVKSDNQNLLTSHVVVDVEVASINTSVEMRDNHLRTADFFDAEKFPRMSFNSTKFEELGNGKYKMYGVLKIKEIEKPIVLEVVHNGSYVDDKTGNTIAGFEVTGIINRLDFGVGDAFPSAVISNEILIMANMEFISARNK